MRTIAGRDATIRRIASARHALQAAESVAPDPRSRTLTSVAGQPDFTIVVRLHPCHDAIEASALNHWIACESPNKTMVVAEDGLPKTHVFTSEEPAETTHFCR